MELASANLAEPLMIFQSLGPPPPAPPSSLRSRLPQNYVSIKSNQYNLTPELTEWDGGARLEKFRKARDDNCRLDEIFQKAHH